MTQPTLSELSPAKRALRESRLRGRHQAAPIAPRAQTDDAPLSHAQERLWFVDRMHPGATVYNLVAPLWLPGALDGAVLERAVGEVVRRHDVLRTTFREVNGVPVQVVAPFTGFALPPEDLSGLSPAARQAQVRAHVDREQAHVFDLSAGPLFRASLLRLDAGDHLLLLSMHHIVGDAWSMGVFLREIPLLYDAYREGWDSPLPPLPVQYADYAAWQRSQPGAAEEGHLAYWKRQLGGAPELLELPADRPRPPVPSFRGAQVPVEAPLEVLDRLRALANAQGATLHMVLMGAFKVLLARYAGTLDVSVGIVVSGRSRREVEGLIGPFVNTLVLRTGLSGDPTFRTVVERVRETALDAYQHQEVPFERVVAELRPQRSLSHSALYQVAFVLDEVAPAAAAVGAGAVQPVPAPDGAGGLRLAPLGTGPQESTQVDLTLTLRPHARGLSGSLEYATDLFEEGTVRRMASHLGRVLEQVAENADVRLSRLELLGEAEREQVLTAWNRTARGYADPPAHALFAQWARRAPEAVALLSGGEAVTYGELDRRAAVLARHLRDLGVGPETPVGLCMERTPELLVGVLGIWKAGGAYVPLDPQYPAERLGWIVADAALPVVVATADTAAVLPEHGATLVRVDQLADTAEAAEVPLSDASLAYVIYTSGSTGRPKGVLVQHGSLSNLLASTREAFGVGEGDVMPALASYAFDIWLFEALLPLTSGASVRLVDRERVLDVPALVEEIADATLVHAVPALMRQLVNAERETHRLARLRRAFVGGDRVPADLLAEMRAAFPGAGSHVLYGPTEGTILASTHPVPEDGIVDGHPIGRPLGNVRLYVCDGETSPQPAGVPGELLIGGAGVARGYLGRAAMTAERFVPDPFAMDGGARLYRTGDRARWRADGTLEFLGRVDAQVKIRGFRIEPGEIEAVLRGHERVTDCVVMAREDVPGDLRLVAYVVADADAGVLREHLLRELPEYMVPSAFVALDALPLTANGKLDRKALPAPEGDAHARRGYEAPLGEVEAVVAEIWADVLGVERVSRWDHFFELGGHSLLAIKLIERMRRVGLHVEVRALFTTPVLAELAPAVGGAAPEMEVPPNGIPGECESITPEMLPLVELSQEEIDRIVAGVPGGAANVQDIYPLAPLQEGILFHHLLSQDGDPYLTPWVTEFDTRARLDQYLAALQAVIDRHDVLRTAVAWEGLREPVQVVWRHARLPVEEVELDAEAGAAEQQLWRHYDPRRYRMDLRQAPLRRACIAEDRVRGRWLLLMLLHHLTSDHESVVVQREEVQAHLLGMESELPAPLPFRGYVARARLGVSREEHERFFGEMLGDVQEPTAPYGLLDVWGDGNGIGEARLPVAGDLGVRMRRRARALGVSAASLCHLAWAQVLARLTGRSDVVFGTLLLGRMQGGEGADRVMGPLLNTLPVRIEVGEEGVQAAVRRTHALLADLLRHEHASLTLAQRCSGVAAPAPLFTSLLNYRHNGITRPSSEAGQAGQGMRDILAQEQTNYPVMLTVDDWGDPFSLTAQVVAPADPRRVCWMMHTALERLVEALESTPGRAIGSLDVLPEEERRQVVEAWNRTDAEYPADRCVHELFETQAARTPEAVAVRFHEESLSYAALNARANQLAHHLRRRGVGPEVRVGICLERGVEMVVSILAVLKAGGAYVPLDPAYPADRLAFTLSDAGVPVLLAQEKLRATLAVPDGIELITLDGAAEELAAESAENMESGAGPDSLAYVIYTSGSTGTPKGALIEHRNVARLFSATDAWFGFGPDDVWTLFHSCAFDFSVWEIWGALLYGGRLVVVPFEVSRDPEAFHALVRRERVTVLNQTPSAFRQFMAVDAERGGELALRNVIFGGEALEPASLREWVERRGIDTPRLVNMYGITETTVHVTYRPLSRDDVFGGSGSPIGRAIPDLRLYVLDPARRPVPVGGPGELYVGGGGVARGYLNRPELTAQRFIDNPFGAGTLYRTGDQVRWMADGTLEYLGRLDEQVKVRGFRIELGEIESALRGHQGVADCVVVAREDVPGETRLVAYVVGEAEADALRDRLRRGLPEYMVPSAFVFLDALPLTANGKLDRKALPAPQGDAYARGSYAAPLGEVEAALAEIWGEVLGVERVGRHDHFFELGGHSLLAIRLIERMRRAGLYMEVRALFTTPVLAELALAVGGVSSEIEIPANGIPEQAGSITPEMLPLVELSQAEIDRIVTEVPGGAANVQDIYPLAPLQEGIYFHHLLSKEGDPYLLSSVIEFDTRARLDQYLAALQAVIDRHDVLRTAVAREGLREPVQVVLRHARLPVEEVELDAGAGDAAERLWRRYDPRHYRMDLGRAPLLRACIAEDRAGGRWLLLMLMHHVAGDHESMEVLQAEIAAHLRGVESELPVPLPFRNYVAQARLGVSQEEHERFFRDLLGDVDEPTAPYGMLDVWGEGLGIREAWLPVAGDVAARLRRRARALGVSAASLVHLAWAQVLARLSGRSEVVFGTLLFGRMQGGEGADRVMGPFINTLPVRIGVGEEGVEAAVRRTHTLLADLLRHEHASLALAQRCSRVAAPAPLFTSLLNYRYVGGNGRPSGAGQAAEGVRGIHGEERTNYPVVLAVNDLGEELSLTAQVAAPADARWVCRLMHTALERLVEALEDAPGRALGSLDVLPEAERRQVVEEWNRTDAEYPAGACIHQLFEAQAARTPDAEAMVFEGAALTYDALNRSANRLAHHLCGLGVGPDARVAICLERGPEMVTGLLAILKAGGAYVPLDPAYPADRLRYMLKDTGPTALVTQSSLSGTFAGLHVPAVELDAPAPAWAEASETNPGVPVRPGDLAYVIYTSGSTGRPKGVMVEHRSLVNHTAWQATAFGIGAHDTVLQRTSISFDASVWELWTPLATGARMLVLSSDAMKDPAAIGRVIAEDGVTVAQLVPTLLQAVLAARPGAPLPCRILFCGGEPLSAALVEEARAAGAGEVVNLYGPTEATIDSTSHVCAADGRAPAIGRPVANARIYVLDARGEPAPVGVAGELYVGGAGVARGYLGRAGLTAERFVPDPFSAQGGARMYRTGDLGRWRADGTLEFLGRTDFQVKIRGFRIEPGEIEARLAEHPEVREAVVLAREDVPGETRLVAYIVGAVQADALRDRLRQSLPEYMVPAAFVSLEALPLSPNGKLDRKALPAPEYAAGGEYVAPRTPAEEVLAGIWAEVLHLERVGMHDSFFDLGGHSLLIMRLLARIQATFDLEISIRTVFSMPTLEALAAEIERRIYEDAVAMSEFEAEQLAGSNPVAGA